MKEIPKKDLGNTRKAFFNEARMMFQSRHPNVVAIQYV